jgi:hypothetical protein
LVRIDPRQMWLTGREKADAHGMNSRMVKYGMVALTGREKADVADADVVMG